MAQLPNPNVIILFLAVIIACMVLAFVVDRLAMREADRRRKGSPTRVGGRRKDDPHGSG